MRLKKNLELYGRIEEFINSFYEENFRTPSCGEIAAEMGICRTSAFNYLKDLEALGRVDFDGHTLCTEKMASRMDVNPIGILGEVPCGPLTLDMEHFIETFSLPVSLIGTGKLFAVYAEGDSMTGAGIDDGDLVILRAECEARSGDIVCAFVEGEGNTLKRFRPEGGVIHLHPENPAYEDIVVRDCRIQGVAIRVMKNLSQGLHRSSADRVPPLQDANFSTEESAPADAADAPF